MSWLDDVDYTTDDFGELFDELPLWSAPFGLLMLEHVPLRAGATYLDLGSGTGFLAIELAQRAGAGATVHAVDPWHAAAERLRWKLPRLGIANVVVHECDAASLALPDASVDVLVSNLGLNNFEHPDAVLGTCRRVARPGATLHLTTNLTGHMQPFYDVLARTLRATGHAAALGALAEHVAHRGTLEFVSALLERGGFRVHEVRTQAFAFRFADGSALLRHFFIRLGFRPAWKALVPSAARESVFAQLESDLNSYAAGRGGLSLPVPVAYLEARRP